MEEQVMGIQELVEQIASTGKEYGMFYFTMVDTNTPMYDGVKDVARCDYFGVSTETKFIYNTDDAIAFLFDCDIHLWQLMSWEVRYDNCDGWDITLRR